MTGPHGPFQPMSDQISIPREDYEELMDCLREVLGECYVPGKPGQLDSCADRGKTDAMMLAQRLGLIEITKVHGKRAWGKWRKQ